MGGEVGVIAGVGAQVDDCFEDCGAEDGGEAGGVLAGFCVVVLEPDGEGALRLDAGED